MTKLCLALCTGVLLFSYSCSDYIGVKPPKDPPKTLLTYPELITMLEYYDETRKEKFAELIGKDEDTRINYFTLTEVKEYIAYMEKQCRLLNIPLEGINFISASYPDNFTEDPKKSKHQTLIMMPATTVKGETMVSFDPFLSEKEDPMPLREVLERYRYDMWTYDSLPYRSTTRKKMMQTKSSKSLSGGLSPGGNRAGVSPPY